MENMQNKQPGYDEKTLNMPSGKAERRHKLPNEDGLYRLVVFLNVTSWLMLIAALLVFHYARPEFITGLQGYWGIEGRDFWSKEHLDDLRTLLQICLITSLITFVLRNRRNRRKTDAFGYNLLFLLTITVVSLATIYSIS